MKLSEFIVLGEEEKKMAVLHRGVLIGKRLTPGTIFFLFQFDHFYVETSCNTESKTISRYLAFSKTALLEPYLETIAIEKLFRS
jgi:hypothetical protein